MAAWQRAAGVPVVPPGGEAGGGGERPRPPCVAVPTRDASTTLRDCFFSSTCVGSCGGCARRAAQSYKFSRSNSWLDCTHRLSLHSRPAPPAFPPIAEGSTRWWVEEVRTASALRQWSHRGAVIPTSLQQPQLRAVGAPTWSAAAVPLNSSNDWRCPFQQSGRWHPGGRVLADGSRPPSTSVQEHRRSQGGGPISATKAAGSGGDASGRATAATAAHNPHHLLWGKEGAGAQRSRQWPSATRGGDRCGVERWVWTRRWTK